MKKGKKEIKIIVPLEYTKNHNVITVVFGEPKNSEEEYLLGEKSESDTILYQ